MRHLAFLCLLCAFSLPLTAFAARAVQGSVIVSKASKNPVLLWDATADVYAFISQQITDRELNDRLERDALRVIGRKIKSLKTASGTLSLRIYWKQLIPNGTTYNVETLAGVTRYATVTVPVEEARRRDVAWSNLPSGAELPASVTFAVVGPLPPH